MMQAIYSLTSSTSEWQAYNLGVMWSNHKSSKSFYPTHCTRAYNPVSPCSLAPEMYQLLLCDHIERVEGVGFGAHFFNFTLIATKGALTTVARDCTTCYSQRSRIIEIDTGFIGEFALIT
jgi:hypothetical protein